MHTPPPPDRVRRPLRAYPVASPTAAGVQRERRPRQLHSSTGRHSAMHRSRRPCTVELAVRLTAGRVVWADPVVQVAGAHNIDRVSHEVHYPQIARVTKTCVASCVRTPAQPCRVGARLLVLLREVEPVGVEEDAPVSAALCAPLPSKKA